MRFFRLSLLVAVMAALVALAPVMVRAVQDCEDPVIKANRDNYYNCIQGQIDDLGKQLQMSQAATTPLESQLTSLEKQIASIQAQIRAAETRRLKLTASIQEREEDLVLQYALLARKTQEYYKRIRSNSSLAILLSSLSAGEISRDLGYRETAANQNRSLILSLSSEISQLETDKKDAESSKVRLASLQASLDKQSDFLAGEVKKAKDYQASLTGKIASLSALQQSILSGKGETFQTTVGDVPLADDPNSRPDYNPGFSPAFAAFSFGAPHFKGMSQYGAFGRAKSGQSADDILHAYYGGIEVKKDYSTSINITVQGYGTVDIETYAKRIYEMPNSWGDQGGFEALKAQAVAARSYALAYTNNGAKSICATEACQVYKPSNKGGKWEEAVNATRGWVLVSGGQPFSAWYASTSGGYQKSYSAQGHTTPGLWDTPSGRGGWTSQAYEKTAGSPWFYKGWYKDRTGTSCGRSHPWLNSEEMADILNAWVVLRQGGGDSSRVVPVDLNSCWGKSGNPYSLSDLRGIGGYSSVSGVSSITYNSDGFTDSLSFSTNKGNVTISGSEFKEAFNLRAPGRIALKSNLFNIEKK